MNKGVSRRGTAVASVGPARDAGIRDWQRWAPYAAVAWSLIYAALGVYWALGGQGFPFAPTTGSVSLGPVAGRFGQGVAWAAVLIAGIPAAALGVAMLRGLRGRLLRPLFIGAGGLVAGLLLLLMTDLSLLTLLGYIPFVIFRLLSRGDISPYLREAAQAALGHQLLCLIGGFLWLAATVSYARRSSDACLYCGRSDAPESWTSPVQAARWGRIAVYVAMAVPMLYALTRIAWALGLPLGMSEAYWRSGQQSGMWVAGLFLATFGLVGAVLMLGLVQRWGEVFPGWLIGLAGRRVPIALAVVPASLVSVLLVVGGIVIWSSLGQMAGALEAAGEDVTGGIVFQVGPTLLFPVWGIALAVATLGYYDRRRGACTVCGRGESSAASTTAAHQTR